MRNPHHPHSRKDLQLTAEGRQCNLVSTPSCASHVEHHARGLRLPVARMQHMRRAGPGAARRRRLSIDIVICVCDILNRASHTSHACPWLLLGSWCRCKSSRVSGVAVLERSDCPGGGWLVRCDGCGRETLAQIFPDRLVVYDKRHGVRHIAVVPRCELLRALGACQIEELTRSVPGHNTDDIAIQN